VAPKIREFDRQLDELKQRLVKMASVAETMIGRAVNELVTRDKRCAECIPVLEQDLNRMQMEIDDTVLTLLATHQPVAGDLRFLVAAVKIDSDLERAGDLAVNITENVQALAEQPPLKPLIDIPRMTELATKMMHDSIQAFVKSDVLLAQSVIMTDDQVDALKQQVLRELITYMISDPKTIERAVALNQISRHLERIADHATNIAEDVIYVAQGRDVRHPTTPRRRPEDEC
jgi:phosphate transport system protein